MSVQCPGCMPKHRADLAQPKGPRDARKDDWNMAIPNEARLTDNGMHWRREEVVTSTAPE
jgi:hypothetical protein